MCHWLLQLLVQLNPVRQSDFFVITNPQALFLPYLKETLRDAAWKIVLHGKLLDYFIFNWNKVSSNFAWVKIASRIESRRELRMHSGLVDGLLAFWFTDSA